MWFEKVVSLLHQRLTRRAHNLNPALTRCIRNSCGDLSFRLECCVVAQASHKRDACVLACRACEFHRASLEAPTAVEHKVLPARLGHRACKFAHHGARLDEAALLQQGKVRLAGAHQLALGHRELRDFCDLFGVSLERLEPGTCSHDPRNALNHAGGCERGTRPCALIQHFLHQDAPLQAAHGFAAVAVKRPASACPGVDGGDFHARESLARIRQVPFGRQGDVARGHNPCNAPALPQHFLHGGICARRALIAVVRTDDLESSWHGLLPSLDTVEASISRGPDNNLLPCRASYKLPPKEPPDKP